MLKLRVYPKYIALHAIQVNFIFIVNCSRTVGFLFRWDGIWLSFINLFMNSMKIKLAFFKKVRFYLLFWTWKPIYSPLKLNGKRERMAGKKLITCSPARLQSLSFLFFALCTRSPSWEKKVVDRLDHVDISVLYLKSVFKSLSVERPLTATSQQQPLFLSRRTIRSIHWLLWKPLYNGHLSTRATASKTCPQVRK